MLVNPYQVKHMLRTYGKQLVNARRLARFQRQMRGAPVDDQISISREAKRRALVEKVAREIIDNLLVAGAENPVVDEIRQELERRFEHRLVFEYPFMEQELQIFKETEDGPVRLGPGEMQDVLSELWGLTIEKVDETML
ncbi:DVU0524 family FlgM-associated protein [Desulfohalovibrio reitneri]|uniref:DVU0524 family FlgM-associated protein n=1 Tax=Desulfohalovibrio reitneri TaxID=1307759 RepID=UPI0004A6B905|nr:DVU0524 family FlgM-associated protein [Desulfohalovibrio reitneri]